MLSVGHVTMTIINLTLKVSDGVIINTASVAAYEGQIGQVAYTASKGCYRFNDITIST